MARASRAHRFIGILLIISGVLAFTYAGVSSDIAIILAHKQQVPITKTPSSLGLSFRNVAFPSRDDRLLLRGWFIPGILPNGQLTAERTIIMVHGLHANREQNLALSGALVNHGFAVLSFDIRGHGESTPAPQGGGYFEQRDVLGAVDFLRSGPLPYPELGRPRAIGAWGISIGGVAILFAAAQEPAIKALVVDSAYASMESLLKHAFGAAFILMPGSRLTAYMLYGIDYYKVRPVDVVARIAPRAIFFIQGAADVNVSPSNMIELATAASSAPGADVQTWLVPNSRHVEAYRTMFNTYVNRLVTFFTAKLSNETSAAF
jgi:uncharacterized protein